MHSGHNLGGTKAGDDEGKANREVDAPYSTETPGQPAVETQDEQPEKDRHEAQSHVFSEKEHSSSLLFNPWNDDNKPQPQHATSPDTGGPLKPQSHGEERRRQRTEGVPSPSPSPPTGVSNREKDEARLLMPWWAGAFGAAPELRDSPEARGFYARRFCEIFFPDNTVEATAVCRSGNVSTLFVHHDLHHLIAHTHRHQRHFGQTLYIRRNKAKFMFSFTVNIKY